MAAEMPVRDVLCEAMEYLSKLGSNLRIRSENLKEKKIRRDKLTNALAVQKAADKVLLICELSKKSLANVEAGVRKILEHIDVSQASKVGGKNTDDKPKYHYFHYKSRKLKIKSEISLKHYRSVKVLARKMSVLMLEKYPVHYDCKLYRMRRRNERKKLDENKGFQKESEFGKEQKTGQNNKEQQNNSDTDTMKTNHPRISSDKTHGMDSKSKKNKSTDISTSKNNEDSDDQEKIGSDDMNRTESKNSEKQSENISNDAISMKEPQPKKRKISGTDSNQQHDNDDVSMDLKNEKEVPLKNNKDNSGRNHSDSDSAKPMIKCVSISKLLKPDVLQKKCSKPSESPKTKIDNRLVFDVDKKNKMLQAAKKKKEEFWAQKRKEACEFKPKNLVISLIRLPDLNTEFMIENKLKKITKEGNIICEITEDKSDSTVDDMTKKSKEKHSKKSRLSSDILDLNNSDDELLITEANKVKNLLLNDSDTDTNIDNIPKLSVNELDNTADMVKKALLHSDSDQNNDASDNKTTKENENLDSDQNKISDKNTQPDNQDKSRSVLRKSMNKSKAGKNVHSQSVNKSEEAQESSNKDDEIKKCNSEIDVVVPDSLRKETSENEQTASNTNNATNSIINGSSEDLTKTLPDQRGASPQSNKKSIRESVQAKNELLRYSSGSETEDEQLRNTLNEIKKSLLEGMSDEENKLKTNKLGKQCSRSEISSSSEEDILLKKVKKKRLKESDSSSSNKKSLKHKKRCITSDSEEEKKNDSSDDLNLSRAGSRKMVRSKAKPGNSSSYSSDAQDPIDKDIDGLTNIRTLNKTRRRDSDGTDQSESPNSTPARSRMAAEPTVLNSEEVILGAECSSDDSTNNEDNADDEDLPPVSVPGFNGESQHLARDDLLEESDSSESVKEEIKEDSDEEERLNARRRKANLIASSDSETSTARKKAQDEVIKLSDFEDSDDSDLNKRTKRKKKASDSDASAGSSDAGKKKRRRIKTLDEDSDASGSDSENEGKNKHGRKNIRKVMGKNQLEEATKKAAREEKERVARIAERQKMYNNLQFDESGKPDEVVLDKVVLDFDPETKEPLIAVDRGLVKKLKPHQANGIKFMWDACFESVKRIRKDKGSGCILAHCMGLGKTLQVVALTHTLLAHGSLTKVHRVLVVCPLSTVLNWVNEFRMWLKFAERESDIDIYELSRFKQNCERAFQLSQWFEHGGVCVLGYEMFRNLSADNNKKFKKKMLKNFQEALVEPGPDLVVCDEGHLLKNEKTSLSQSMNKVRTLRRIVLTGTPLQNNLKEYYCMVQFVKPNLLGKYNEYLNRFVNPITNGQYTDSTDHDIKIMKRRSHVLHKMLDGAVQRRDYGVLAPFLPPKHEYVLFITLTEVQTKLYQFYLDNYSRRPLPGKSSGFLFPDFQSLQRIWTHPLVLKYNSERYEIMQQKKRDKEEEDSEGSLVDFIDDESTPDESSSAESTDDSSELSDDSRKKSKKKKSSKKSKGKDKDKDKESAAASRRRGTRANPIDLDLDDKDDDILEVKNENPTEWWIKMVEEDVLEDMRNSHKLVLLFDILRQCETIGDKLLVFSQSLYSLDLIEHFLGKVDEATQEGRIDEKLGNHVGSWSPGVDYFRLDGSTSCENRSIWCKNFNREDNPRARLFLISTRAGGLGINLVAANRVVIFDVSWNPSHDVQSIFRVYRFGQKKPCYVYRFLAMGTMEEKIYERQVTKQAISKRVIDEQQIDRHYAENDLAELYKFEAEPPTPRPLPPLPKDRLFAEMLREHEAQIYKYHEHDSLLENKEEETLSEEERKAAWEDFENEKNRPPPAPFPAPWPMHNGMVPNLLAQQQQQLAYAALAAMLRKDMPNINDNQIRDMLPMIYNANPALMQKMSEIYKYSQQMSMPGMMGQAGMNPGAGSGGGMGGMGASGLQYEPPWQRQQQQQQQMRLQQLLAQQQNMGAASKYYAGGLGSRDPVAMALQQQRAREIMVGGGAGRPRGRPPLQPRGPPAASADVVNLDSD